MFLIRREFDFLILESILGYAAPLDVHRKVCGVK